MATPIAILDIDGTLVDTNYHHVVAWGRAFAQHDIVAPLWQVHRHMGMGGDKLVEAVTDARTEPSTATQSATPRRFATQN